MSGRRRPFRIYTGTIRLKPGTVNSAVVDVSDRIFRMRTRYKDERDSRGHENGRDRDENGQSNHDNDDVYYRDEDRGPDRDSGAQSGQEGFGSFPHGRGNDSKAQAPGNVLKPADMDALRRKVEDKITDTDKEKLLKGELGNRQVTTEQVRVMLGWLSFESSRLDFAKWAYGRCADPGNYQKLEDVFDFGSSKEEFNRAIQRR
jgi:hypothetical protein